MNSTNTSKATLLYSNEHSMQESIFNNYEDYSNTKNQIMVNDYLEKRDQKLIRFITKAEIDSFIVKSQGRRITSDKNIQTELQSLGSLFTLNDTMLCQVEETTINKEALLKIRQVYDVQFSGISKITLTIKNPI